MPSPPKRPPKKPPKKPNGSPTKKSPKKSTPPKKSPKKSPPKKTSPKKPPKRAVNPIEIIKDLPPEVAFEIGLHLGSQEADKLLGAVVNQLPLNYYRHELTSPATRLTDIDAAMRYKKLYDSFSIPREERLNNRQDKSWRKMSQTSRCDTCVNNKRRCSSCAGVHRGYGKNQSNSYNPRYNSPNYGEAMDQRARKQRLDWSVGL